VESSTRPEDRTGAKGYESPLMKEPYEYTREFKEALCPIQERFLETTHWGQPEQVRLAGALRKMRDLAELHRKFLQFSRLSPADQRERLREIICLTCEELWLKAGHRLPELLEVRDSLIRELCATQERVTLPGELRSETMTTAGGGSEPPAATPPSQKFPLPPGTTWSQISIRFLDGHTVTVTAGSTAGRFNFAEMGMKDARNGNPNAQWRLLEILANSGGRLSWQNRSADSKNKKQVELLSRRLRDFFGIPESPFHPYKKGIGWRIKIHLEAPR
jgi:hypothetical protein